MDVWGWMYDWMGGMDGCVGGWVDGWLGDGRLVGGEWACGLLESVVGISR